MCRFGGISHLRVVGNTEGDVSKFTPTIVGFNAQGDAYAGRKGESVSVPTFDSFMQDDDKTVEGSVTKPHSASWTNATINLNINEISERIRKEEKWQRGVYSTDAWAYHINRSVKKGVVDAGVKHLAIGLNGWNWGSALFQYGTMGVWEGIVDHPPTLQSVFFRVFFVSGVCNAWDYVRFRNSEYGFRWSAFYGPQLDRALLLKLFSGRAPLVKTIS